MLIHKGERATVESVYNIGRDYSDLGFSQVGRKLLRLNFVFLQLHVNSSKDLSFLGYIVLVSSECAQM